MTIYDKNTYKYVSIVVIGGLIFGLDAAIISGAIKYIKVEFGLTPLQVGTMVGAPGMGANIALFFIGWLASTLGRKKTLLIIAALYLASVTTATFANGFYMLVLSRFLGGLAFTSLGITSMYIGETAPAKIRGKFVSGNQFAISIGFFVSYFINYLIAKNQPLDPIIASHSFVFSNNHIWRFMIGSTIIPCAIWFLLLLTIPESPRWLVLKKRYDEAEKSLKVFYPADKVKGVLEDIKHNLATVKKVSIIAQLKELFSPRMKMVLILGLGLSIGQSIAGMGVVSYYSPMIFEQVGLGADSALFKTVLLGVIAIVASGVTMLLVDRFGRRPLYIIGALLIFIAHTTIWYTFSGTSYNLNQQTITTFQEKNKVLLSSNNLTANMVTDINDNPTLTSQYMDITSKAPSITDGITPKIAVLLQTDDKTKKLYTDLMARNAKLIDIKPLQDSIGQSFDSDVKFKSFLKTKYNKSVLGMYEGRFIQSFIHFKLNPMFIVVAIFLFKGAFSFAVGPLLWVLFSEITPNSVRSIGIPFFCIFGSVIAWATQKYFPWELANLGASHTFLLYAVLGVISLVFLIFVLPETKNKTLEEIEGELVKNT